MDQALKQRLIGATVLIALGVIFLPVFIGGSDDQAVSLSSDEFLIPPQPQILNDGASPGRRLPLVQPSSVNPVSNNNENNIDLSSGEIRLPRPDEALPEEQSDSVNTIEQHQADLNNAAAAVDDPIEPASDNVLAVSSCLQPKLKHQYLSLFHPLPLIMIIMRPM